jgi:hypothetical protein
MRNTGNEFHFTRVEFVVRGNIQFQTSSGPSSSSCNMIQLKYPPIDLIAMVDWFGHIDFINFSLLLYLCPLAGRPTTRQNGFPTEN